MKRDIESTTRLRRCPFSLVDSFSSTTNSSEAWEVSSSYQGVLQILAWKKATRKCISTHFHFRAHVFLVFLCLGSCLRFFRSLLHLRLIQPCFLSEKETISLDRLSSFLTSSCLVLFLTWWSSRSCRHSIPSFPSRLSLIPPVFILNLLFYSFFSRLLNQ